MSRPRLCESHALEDERPGPFAIVDLDDCEQCRHERLARLVEWARGNSGD